MQKPDDTDTLVVAVLASGQILPAQSTVGGGAYGVLLSQAASFNGTNLVLRLKHGGVTFKLLRTDGSEAIVPFNGQVLPLGRTIMDLVASSQVVDAGTGTATAW